MRGDSHDVVAQYDGTVIDRLHDVPPHRVYEVELDGRRAVLKVGTGPRADPEVEGRVVEFVARETSVPAPEVLAVGENHFVAEWLDDTPPEGAEVDDLKARTMGAGLASLHEQARFDATGFPAAGDGALTIDRHASWADTVEAFIRDLHGYLATARPDYAPVAAEVVEFVRGHPETFDVPGDPVLCHGNYLPDHVGIDRDRAAASAEPSPAAVRSVIDFEHALVAPAEYDYWRSVFPLDTEVDGPLANAFRAGYESVRPLPDGLADRRPAFAAVILVEYFQSLFLQGNLTGADAERRAEGMADALAETLAALREEHG